MREILAQAHARLIAILRQVEDAQRLAAQGSPARAANLAHDADLACLATADVLSQAFEQGSLPARQTAAPAATAASPRYRDGTPEP